MGYMCVVVKGVAGRTQKFLTLIKGR